MTPTDIVLIVLVVGVIGAVIRFWPKKMPKERMFRCRRCRAVTPHNGRTIDAWRSGKTAFSCDACHRAWHADRTPVHAHRAHGHAGRMAKRKGGCFTMVVGLVALPILAIAALVRWA
jgi:hypothetical protein